MSPHRGVARSFSVNMAIGRYFCHRCQSHGNQLELWAAATKLPLHQAAMDLCRRLGRDIPWIRALVRTSQVIVRLQRRRMSSTRKTEQEMTPPVL